MRPQPRRDFGDPPWLLEVVGTPTVVVMGRDRAVVNVWSDLIDAEIPRQSVVVAKETAPAA